MNQAPHMRGQISHIDMKAARFIEKYNGSFFDADLVINGEKYKLGFNREGGVFPCKFGDEVEFYFDSKLIEYADRHTGEKKTFMVKNIINNAANKSFKNITNPALTAPKPKGAGGSWGGNKRDPDEQVRIMNQSQIANAITLLCHNMPGTQIKKDQVCALAAELVDFCWTNKPAGMQVVASIPPAQLENQHVHSPSTVTPGHQSMGAYPQAMKQQQKPGDEQKMWPTDDEIPF